MKMQFVVLGLIAFAGLSHCTLIEAPSHTAVKYGSEVEMKCTVSNKDAHLVYWQAKRVADSGFQQIYYSPSGALKDWVKPVEDSTYDLRINNVNFNTSGTYKCDYLTADVYSMEAELMTMGDVNCGESGGSHNEGSNVPFICSVKLTGSMDPTLTWYQGDREVRGGKYIEQILEEGEKEPPPFAPRVVQFYQNITVNHMSDGEEFTCRLSFSKGTESNPEPPSYTDSCILTLGVTYGATSIEIDPNPSDWNGPRTDDGIMERNVGDKFTCSAKGNPLPTIIWYKIEDGMQISLPSGADLVITEEMRGYNHYNCTARNEPRGQPRNAHRAIKFHVGGYSIDTGESKGDGGSSQVVGSVALLLAALLTSLGLVNHHKH